VQDPLSFGWLRHRALVTDRATGWGPLPPALLPGVPGDFRGGPSTGGHFQPDLPLAGRPSPGHRVAPRPIIASVRLGLTELDQLQIGLA
jgi:hypothetical protein